MKQKLINNVFRKLLLETDIKAKFTQASRNVYGRGIDGRIDLNIRGAKVKFHAVIKNEIRNYQIQTLWTMQKEFKPIIVVAKRLFPKIKDALREMKIAYLEENGNCYIDYKGVYVHIDGNKTVQRKEQINRAFTKTGLRVIYQYLINPVLINAPHRDIATYAGVALGNITYVKNGLKELGYLINLNKKELKLVNISDLFEKWVDAYGKTLKPTLYLGSYRFTNREKFIEWEKLELNPKTTNWGGEAAGKLYTKHLRPEILTVYSIEKEKNLMRKLRLIPDQNGNIEIYDKFWNNELTKQPITDPILTYSDLVSTRDGRCLEIAEQIYKAIIDGHLQRIS